MWPGCGDVASVFNKVTDRWREEEAGLIESATSKLLLLLYSYDVVGLLALLVLYDVGEGW